MNTRRTQPARNAKKQQPRPLPARKAKRPAPRRAPIDESSSDQEEMKVEPPAPTIDSSSDPFAKIKAITRWVESSANDILQALRAEVEAGHRKQGEEEICPICRFEVYEKLWDKDREQEKEIDVVRLGNCESHWIHKDCAEQLRQGYDFLQCPTCLYIYGIKTGDQPPGTMNVHFQKSLRCAGQQCGTHVINYHFPNGKRADGRDFYGTSRTAYIPDNQEGREVLGLLREGFKRKLLFTIGTSVTTGMSDCVIWNGVHHKTNTSGGSTHYGYPDNTYFGRVKEELASKGVLAVSRETAKKKKK